MANTLQASTVVGSLRSPSLLSGRPQSTRTATAAGRLCVPRAAAAPLPSAPRGAPLVASCPPADAVVGSSPAASQQRRRAVVAAAGKQTFGSFDDMIASADVVLVDFYATWCGPCQIMAGVLQQVSAQLGDAVRIVKVDTEKYPKLATKYGVQGLPTLMLFRQGKIIDRVEGALSAQDLIMRMNYMLSSSSPAP
eukprot:TRINITY_DN96_c0_g1_i1.p1 TRINITY_DN96_c0_g1~~TRINITY_DN96_c0_g1_i1.p1  ORF type:complete len:194 (+),score=7.08 TRINITY_DN96_c0_g1_i1:75-656(+)